MRTRIRTVLSIAAALVGVALCGVAWSFWRDVRETERLLAIAEGNSDISLRTTTILPDWILRNSAYEPRAKWLLRAATRVEEIMINPRDWDEPSARHPNAVGRYAEILAVAHRHRRLRSLDLHGHWLNDKLFALVRPIEGLDRLSFRFTRITDRSLATIARHRNLSSLEFEYCGPVDDRSLADLAPLSRLTRLTISSETFTWGLGTAGFSRFPRLQLLSLRRCLLTHEPDVAFRDLAQCQELHLLELEYINGAIGPHLRHLGALPRLSNLWVTGGSCSAGKIPDDFGLQSLEWVSLDEIEGEGAMMDQVVRAITASAHRLTRFRVMNSPAGDTAVASLSRCRDLEWLNFEGTRLTDAGIAALGPMPKLVSLVVSGTAVTSDGIAAACRHFPLTALHAERTDIDDEGLTAIASAPTLEELNLADTCITDAGLKHLTTCGHIKVLGLDGNSITDEGARTLHALVGIHCGLGRTNVSVDALELLESATEPPPRPGAYYCGTAPSRIQPSPRWERQRIEEEKQRKREEERNYRLELDSRRRMIEAYERNQPAVAEVPNGDE